MLVGRTLAKQTTVVPDLGGMALRLVRRYLFVAAFAAAMAAVFVYRLSVLRPQAGLGIDAADYLTTMWQLFGTDVTGEGLTRPPLVGVALWPLAQLFGPLAAAKLLAVAASVLLCLPFYVLCSRFTSRGVALAVSLLFVFSPRYMDAANWGFLTLVGVGLSALCFCLIYDILTASRLSRGRVLALALISLALLGTNRSSAFICVITALVLGAVLLIVRRDLRGRGVRLLPAALLALLLSLLFATTYSNASFAIGDRRFLAIAQSWQDLRNGWETLRHFFPADPPLLWAAVGGMAVAGFAGLVRGSRERCALLLTLFLVPLALCMLVVGEIAERAGYFLYLPVWLSIAVCAEALIRAIGRRRTGATEAPVWGLALLALVAVLTIWRGHVSLRDAAAYYGYLSAEHVDAIQTADGVAPAGVGVAYPWSLGQWTKGLSGRRVYSPHERSTIGSDEQKDRTLMVDALLTGERVTTNGSTFVADAYSTPDTPMDPVVGVDNGVLRQLVYLDDGLIEIEYGDGPDSRRLALGEAQSEWHATAREGDAWVDRRTYTFEDFEVVKEVKLPEGSDEVAVTLRVHSQKEPITSVLVPVQSALPSVPVSLGAQQAIFGFAGWNPFGSKWSASTQVDVLSGRGAPTMPELTLAAGSGETLWRAAGKTLAVALLKPQSPDAEVTLLFTTKGWPSGDRAGLRTLTAEDAIEDLQITFAVVDRQPSQPWFGDPLAAPAEAWLESGPYFQRLSDDGRVAAYQVVPSQ